jgi:hypothetical protein
MFRRTAKVETPIEKIFCEETGRKMQPSIRRILLHKPTAERKPHLRLLSEEPRMPGEEWIKTLADGRRVKFTIQELPDDRVFMTAQIEKFPAHFAGLTKSSTQSEHIHKQAPVEPRLHRFDRKGGNDARKAARTLSALLHAEPGKEYEGRGLQWLECW